MPARISSFALVFALIAPQTLRAETPVASLADGRAGTIFLASSTPAGPDQYLEAPKAAPRIGAPDGARFAAHVALYPACNTRYLAAEVTGAPILMLLGGADDQTPPAPCHRYGEWFRAKGAASKVVEYPGARHLFDGSGPDEFIASATGGGRCDMEYDTETRATRRTDTGAVIAGAEIGAYFRTCATHGVNLGSDPQARAAAEREIAAHLKAALRSP